MRTIIRHPNFENALEQLREDYDRVDEFVRGLEWVLSRNPKSGTCVNRSPLTWFIPAADIFERPMGVSYTFNDESIYLLDIWCSEDDG